MGISNMLVNAQNALLGSIMISPEITGDILSQTCDEDFTGSNKVIYAAVKKLFRNNEKIDAVTIVHETGSKYNSYCLELMQVTPTAQNYKTYLKILKEQSLVYQAKDIGYQINQTSDPDEVRELINKAALLLVTQQSNWKVYSMEDLMHLFFNKYANKPEYLDWGIPSLNKQVYAEQGDFIIIGGRPSVGKTAFAIEVAINISKTKKVGFFSFETGPSKFIDRVVSHGFRVDLTKIKRRELNLEEFTRISHGVDSGYANGVKFIHASGMTADDIKSTALAYKFDVIFVDYLQIVNSGMKNAMAVEQTRAISQGLHNLAQGCGITVVSLAQLKRAASSDAADKAPSLQDLKESGQIEQDADTIMFLYRKEAGVRNSPRLLKVAKNKEGMCGTTELIFEGKYQTFTASGCNADDELTDEELSEVEPEQLIIDDDENRFAEKQEQAMKNLQRMQRGRN